MKKLEEIFVDIEQHIEAGRFIKSCSTNRLDIRQFTFDGEDLAACRTILDLGCAYGYFTRGLKGWVHPQADITGIDLWEGCAKYYVKTCRNVGLTARFCLSTRPFCARFPANRYDLALCSYALYFFPDAVAEIAGLLNEHGTFIAVTHRLPHMQELVGLLKTLLAENGYGSPKELPGERLIAKFSSANGRDLLSPFFKEIKIKEYGNSLRIDAKALPKLMNYLRFKRPLFFPEELHLDESFLKRIEARLQEEITAKGSFTITKNDVVFVCKAPGTREGK